MTHHEAIQYLEIPSSDLAASKQFFSGVFGWRFTDYVDGYCAFSSETMEGGFYLADQVSLTDRGACLIVFYSETLERTQDKLTHAGAQISQNIFSFPGGRRFHFIEPGGSEFAVWSDR